MPNIEFPKPLKNLLEDSPLQASIRAYADRAGDILADNKLPFFPDYTDHGTDHINRVLASEVELVPDEVWRHSERDSRPRLLGEADAAVLIGATLLHDIAMHLRPAGFLELVGEDSRFRPLPWFDKEQEGHTADRPWRELWLDFQREARRFSDRDLGNIIGLESVRAGWKFDALPGDPGQWETNHGLVIGEFIRRHHARLAHEIAVYGFPGLGAGSGEGEFPALGASGHPLQRWADLIGLAARSHGLSLRVCQAYLDANPRYPRTPKPMNCAVLYAMALLRVADYLQIDRQRTPPALLKLRNPQSPVSVREWSKHLAVLSIDPARDPRAKMVTVSPDISQSVYLQLRDLLDGLQGEMDHSTAVLGEVYGARVDLGLDRLTLATRRVDSNLRTPVFRASLPYVPERTGFSTDPNLLTLLVEPLYGKEPGVGVRELMQNSVDAVRELHAWCEAHGKKVEDLDLPEQEADVQIDFIQREDGSWFLRCTDKGIGMTADTIQNYFLRAGASFRNSPEWTKEFVGEDGKPKVLRAGRFGIGAFAVFLLGPRFRLWTRHVTAGRGEGFYLRTEINGCGIEICRDRNALHIGTTIDIELGSSAAYMLEHGLENSEIDKYEHRFLIETDWYCLNWPSVRRRVVRDLNVIDLAQRHYVPTPQAMISPEWSSVYCSNFGTIYWTFWDFDSPHITCNGFRISTPDSSQTYGDVDDYDWPESGYLMRPSIAILDDSESMPITIQRYGLSDESLPFVDYLARDAIFSVIAHAVICGPTDRTEAHVLGKQSQPHPLACYKGRGHQKDRFGNGILRWCSSANAFVPGDKWLFSLLKRDACIIFGGSGFGYFPENGEWQDLFELSEKIKTHAILSWYGCNDDSEVSLIFLADTFYDLIENGFNIFISSFSKISAIVSERSSIDMIEHIKNPSNNAKNNWKDIFKSTSKKKKRKYSALNPETFSEILSLDSLFEAIEINNKPNTFNDFCFFVDLTIDLIDAQPETLLAKIWNECLGPNPIPFDPAARAALIERGRQHPELKRHIEAWEEMKRTGSKWVYGDQGKEE